MNLFWSEEHIDRWLGGVGDALGHQYKNSVGARSTRFAPQHLPQSERRRVGDHEHVLAVANAQAVVDYRAHRARKVTPIDCPGHSARH